MKQIKYIICAFCVICGFASCLDLDPQDQIGGDKMWATESDFKNFANNFYGWLPDFSSVYNDGSPHSDSRSDILTYQTPNVFSHGSNTVPENDGNYTGNYAHIRRCNLLLENAESYSNKDAIKQYVGEAYFFRAWSHFELVQLYGDVVIVKDVLDLNSRELTAPRDNRSDVIDFVIEDLNNAIDNLSSAANITEEGRVSKEAAQAFLSRVALFEGTWQKFHFKNTSRANELFTIAANAAKKVIDGGRFQLFGTTGNSIALGTTAQKYLFILENDLSNPAKCTKADNKEYILARRHDTTLYPIGKDITAQCVNNPQWITRNFAQLYLCSDGLPITKSSRFQGYANKNSEFQNRDNRMRNNLLMPGTRYWKCFSFPRVNWEEGNYENSQEYNGQNGSGYNNQKWGAERACDSGSEGYDWPVIRYAEVLLNYAEAIFERDGSISDADLDYSLNLVRLRVNPEMPKLSNGLVNSNGLSMREEIRRERTVELYQEGFRIDDLKRWATAVEVMSQPLLGVKYTGTEFQSSGWNGSNLPKNGEGCLILEQDRTWTEKNYLLPIPSKQLELNPQLKQNIGWE